MILLWLILIPLLGGLLAWIAGRRHAVVTRWTALATAAAQFVIALALWMRDWREVTLAGGGPWLLDYDLTWIPQAGIHLHLALDGINLLLVVLTAFLGILSVAASWTGITDRVGFFHFVLLWTISGITGVFLAVDLFLFYFFWEVMIIPLYFLIDIWGHEQRHYAAVKFFIFTQTGGLFLLLGILGLYFIHGQQTGEYTFNYFLLLGTAVPPEIAFWLMLGFFVAFAVKLPAVPVHSWLPDAHTQAPVAGSVDLAGLVLKVGAYGLLRFTVPLFPQAALAFAPVAMTLAVIGILYGALLAFAQTDLKRLVAYTSISHMGFVLLGIFAWNALSLQGVMIVILAHGFSTGVLFILVGAINQRLKTRDLRHMGGLRTAAPRLGGAGLFFALASLGLPGMANFIGEFLVLLGAYRVSPVFAAIAAVGMILSLIYALRLVQRIFFGPVATQQPVEDLSLREIAMVYPAMVVLLWTGLYPQTVLNTLAPALTRLLHTAPAAMSQVSDNTQPELFNHPYLALPRTSPPGPSPGKGGECWRGCPCRCTSRSASLPLPSQGRGLGGEVRGSARQG